MSPAVRYPESRLDVVEDRLGGLHFPDPYRWLEAKTPEVREWQRAQATLATDHVREWPHFERLKQVVERFSVPSGRSAVVPRFAAGRWFRMQVAPGATQAQAIISDSPTAKGRVLFDPLVENPARPPFLSWIAPSPDGRTLAVGVCSDGSENNTIRLIDVETGELLADAPQQTLMDNWTGGVSWLADSTGFFFSAITGAAIDFTQQVYLHTRIPKPNTEIVEVDWTLEISPSKPRDYRMVVVSSDGRYAVAMERRRHPIPVAIAELGRFPLVWRPFVNAVGESIVAGHVVGNRFVAVTDVGAPRGRLVSIPLDASNPNDPSSWQELMGETDAVMRTLTVVGELLYLHELLGTYSRVRILSSDGKLVDEVPLPDRGAISEHPFWMMNLVPRGHPDEFLFGFSSLSTSPGLYRHRPGRAGLETLVAPQIRLSNVVVEDHCAISADGSRVPYHVVRRSDIDPNSPQPTLIFAYGGFNSPHLPHFPGPMAAFITAGGLFVHAHLRGGGDLGREWWDGGRWANKQNCYDDLFAVAEDLIATNRTTADCLAMMGGSNGGLMAGVAATQRPDLWKVVISRFPIVDLIGACREPYGRQAVMSEYCANLDDAKDVKRLATISPYHLVREGVQYPAVFLDVGDTDPRCSPWQARKFAARLQSATAGSAPVLLHVWDSVGHGWATAKDIALLQNVEWIAFVMRHLEMSL